MVICDVPGVFMQAKKNEKLVMSIDGQLAKLILRVDQSCKRYITQESGKDIIYVILDCTIYRTL